MKFLKHTYITAFFLLLPFVVGAQTIHPSPIYKFENPLKVDTICGALELFLQALLTLGVPVAVLFLVYAGFLFVWARGNPAGLEKAKHNLFWVIIGIGIYMGAWFLGQVIASTLNTLASQTNTPNPQIGSCQTPN